MPNSFADAIFWVAVACCIVAQAAIVRSVLVAPATEAADPRERVPRPRRAVEIAYAVVPGIALAVVLVATWHAMHRPGPLMPPPGTAIAAAGPAPTSALASVAGGGPR